MTRIGLFIFFCLLCNVVSAQNFYDLEISDQVRLGGPLNEELTDIISVSDDAYMVSGISLSASWESYITQNYGFEDIWLVGLNDELDITSSNIHGSGGNERVFNMIKCGDGGIAMCGYIQAGVPPHIFNGTENLDLKGDFDLLLMKVDAEGNLLWVKNFGGTDKEFGYDLVELQNGDLLVTGFTESSDGDVSNHLGQEDFWLLRTTSEGELIWEKTYGGSNDDKARSMILKDNDAWENEDVWLLGSSKSSDVDVSENFGTLDIWLVSINIETGELNWEKSFGGTNGDVGHKMAAMNTGAVICGQSSSQSAFGEPLGTSGDDVVLMTVDELGDMTWSTLLGGSSTDFLRDVLSPAPYIEGDIVLESVVYLAGYSFSNDQQLEAFDDDFQEENAWVIAYDLEAKQIQNAGLFGGNDEDQYNALLRKADQSNILCAGFTKSIDGDLGKHGAHDGWVVELTNPNSIGFEETIGFEIKIGPNPASDKLLIETSLESYAMRLYDLTGKVLYASAQQNSFFGASQIDVSKFSAGVYFLEICNGTNCQSQKVIKQ